MSPSKEWSVYCNGTWSGYARADSAEQAIAKVQAKRPDLPVGGRWSAR